MTKLKGQAIIAANALVNLAKELERVHIRKEHDIKIAALRGHAIDLREAAAEETK